MFTVESEIKMSRSSLKSVMRLLDADNKPVEQLFLRDLKRSIELTADKSSRKPSQTYKPSSMNCIRNMYYQVIGVEQDAGESSYISVGICNAGSDIHERIQQAVTDMKNNGIDCEYIDVGEFVKSRKLKYLNIVAKQGMETKLFHKDLKMSFLTDGIIRYRGKYYILELKTETGRKFYQRIGVDEKHYNQGIAYSLAFGIDDVIFVYISRDILDMKSYMFNVTEDMRRGLKDKIKECDEYVAKKCTPPKPDTRGGKLCDYCAYQKTCEREG